MAMLRRRRLGMRTMPLIGGLSARPDHVDSRAESNESLISRHLETSAQGRGRS